MLYFISISILIWNYQGAGNPFFFLSAFRLLINKYKPDVIVLLEPYISGKKAVSFIIKMGFQQSHRAEASGFFRRDNSWASYTPFLTKPTREGQARVS